MREAPSLHAGVRLGAVGVTIAGMALIAASGARGPRALLGLGMFCLGLAAQDGLYRRAFGFRQVSLFFGIAASALGLWSALATALLVLLELPVAPELRTLLVAAAGCAAGSAGMALLAVKSPAWLSVRAIRGWMGGLSRRTVAGASRLGEPRRDRRYDAGQPFPRAGQVRGG